MFELISTLVLASAYMVDMPKDAMSDAVLIANKAKAVSVTELKLTNKKNDPVTFEEYVREYYTDTPILAEIAFCESSFRHFAPDGEAVRGKVNKGDVGVMQINEYYHEDTANKLGLDLETIDGNLAYAQYLYDREGAAPWVSSSKCWKKSLSKVAKLDSKVAVKK
jgi:hypothetical protein